MNEGNRAPQGAHEALDVYKSYKKSPYLSIKHSSYFLVYEDLLEKYRNKPIVFVEVGVLNGGSLFMWRDYLGPRARVIGVDLNPEAKRWESHGFEIHIGSQSDPAFWRRFFETVGDVDVVLDDGGHTFDQQIVTVHECLDHIRDGGLMIVEDTHTSYFREFGYPSRYSFMEWTKRLVDNVNSRFPSVKVCDLPYKNSVFSISVYESIVAMKIQRDHCIESVVTSNEGESMAAIDMRHKGDALGAIQAMCYAAITKFPFLVGHEPTKALLLRCYRAVFARVAQLHSRFAHRALKRYF